MSATTVNLDEMASVLRVSLPTMRSLLKRYPDLPVIARGSNGVPWQFDPVAVTAFIAERKAEDAAADQARSDLLAQVALPLADPDLASNPALSAGDRLKHAQAAKAEDELRRTRGFLVLTTEMRQRLLAVWPIFGGKLQALPMRVGRRHNLPDVVIRDMRAEVSTIQRELVASLKEALGDDFAPEPEEPEDAEAA